MSENKKQQHAPFRKGGKLREEEMKDKKNTDKKNAEDKIEESQKKIQQLEDKIKKMEKDGKDMNEKLNLSENSVMSLEEEVKTSKGLNQQLQSRIQELEDKIKKMEKDGKELNEKLNLSENRNKSLEKKNITVEGLNQQMHTCVKSLEEENKTVIGWNQKLESKLSECEHYLQQQNQELQGCQGQNEHLRFRIDDLQSRNAEVEQENKYLKEQVDELTMRSSSFASKQLSEGNQNVADFSDQSRPTKIGEKFGTLYDDEWFEAYDALSNNEDRSEEDIIQYLIKIIQDSYKFCEYVAKAQLQQLNEKMKTLMTKFEYKDSEGLTHEINSSTEKNPSIDSARAKYARDYRKAAAAESLLGVKKMFKETKLKEELEKFSGEEKDAIISYIDKCTELIWFMVVQDPPMVFDIPEPGRPFNDQAFKYYKTKGKFVKLAVCPAVKLCDNGGLISKGYALPK